MAAPATDSQAATVDALPARAKPWRRYFRTTREGKAFLFVTLGVGLAAINTGNNLLFLIFGFLMSLIVLSGILSEIVLRGVRVTRRLPGRSFAGSLCLVEINLTNTKQRVPSYSLEVEDLVEGFPAERRCYFLKVGANAEQIAGYRRTIKRRGYVKFKGFRVATRYPFGIIEKWRLLDSPEEMLVYPALLPEDLLDNGERGVGRDTTTARIGLGTEVAGLRNYQQGDAARSIHWRRTAALGRVVVHEKHSDASAHLTIVLDNARPTAADASWDEGFERAISRAAALAAGNAGRDLSREVVCRGQRSQVVMAGAPSDPILRFLALLQSVPSEQAKAFGLVGKSSRVIEIPVVPSPRAA